MVRDLKWGDAIKGLRLEKGVRQTELADAAGVLRSHLAGVESGRIKAPGRPFLEQVAGALGLTIQELANAARQASTEFSGLNQLPVSALRVPIIGEAHAGPEGILGPIEDYAYWSRSKAADRNIIGIICRGFCLEPEVREGDIIFIDQDLSGDPGDMVLVTVGDEIRLVPWNQGRHGLPADAVIQGVVVEVSRRLR
jgi:transcriptional regulator with XRE-family HTH domain